MLDDLLLILTGFVMVMIVLALLWGLCALVGWIFTHRPQAPVAQPAAPPPALPAASGPVAIPPAHVAAIGAAVASVLGGRARVLQIRAPVTPANPWPTLGRFSHFSGHHLRPGWGHARSLPDSSRGTP
ncbi:OadG family transporter subunit [Pararhodospirillum photometricum]|uniref:Uncharacterized protein n=1 Tax=Pararhodospirillum photometricum DSM 122 TaxID=1150469 RepID=H6SNH2_PARPM|nr:OadG family transporter subunit [Pararhodospirillum photometricum]CCG09303.1 unnamed protein product [Pararhodospirillum photometricum DSM 122]